MRRSDAYARMNGRNSPLRRYVDRHSGFVIGIAFGFAVLSCLGLILVFGIYAFMGGDDGLAALLGLCLWLGVNILAIRRFLAFLRQRAMAEYQRYLRPGGLETASQLL